MHNVANITVKYVKFRDLEHPMEVCTRADLLTQSDTEGRAILYRDTLLSLVEEFFDENDFTDRDKMFLEDLEIEHISIDKEGTPVYPDWYVFD